MMISAEIHQSLRAYSCTVVLIEEYCTSIQYRYTNCTRTVQLYIGNPTARTGTTGITPVPVHCIQIPYCTVPYPRTGMMRTNE